MEFDGQAMLMVFRRSWRPAASGAILLAIGGFALAHAQSGGSTPRALAGLEKGQWELKPVEGGPARKLCLTNPNALIQLEHAQAQCSQVVMDNTATSVTVRYTCPGHGHGRTTVSVETPRLANIETQGVVDGMPFADQFEGRRTGACTG
jgi:hypothetical protein